MKCDPKCCFLLFVRLKDAGPFKGINTERIKNREIKMMLKQSKARKKTKTNRNETEHTQKIRRIFNASQMRENNKTELPSLS